MKIRGPLTMISERINANKVAFFLNWSLMCYCAIHVGVFEEFSASIFRVDQKYSCLWLLSRRSQDVTPKVWYLYTKIQSAMCHVPWDWDFHLHRCGASNLKNSLSCASLLLNISQFRLN